METIFVLQELELENFAKEFNSMCEDVEKYELVVEKSRLGFSGIEPQV